MKPKYLENNQKMGASTNTKIKKYHTRTMEEQSTEKFYGLFQDDSGDITIGIVSKHQINLDNATNKELESQNPYKLEKIDRKTNNILR